MSGYNNNNTKVVIHRTYIFCMGYVSTKSIYNHIK